MRYLIVAGVGEIIMFIGKLMIAAGATACFYLLITFVDTIKENVLEPIYLLVVWYVRLCRLYFWYRIWLLCCLWPSTTLPWIPSLHASLWTKWTRKLLEVRKLYMPLKNSTNSSHMKIEPSSLQYNYYHIYTHKNPPFFPSIFHTSWDKRNKLFIIYPEKNIETCQSVKSNTTREKYF